MHAASNQAGEVRHVHQVQRAHFIGDLPHALKINEARIRAAATNDQLRLLALSDLLQFVIINRLFFFGHAIGDNAVSLAGEIQMMSMREMTAMRQVQT